MGLTNKILDLVRRLRSGEDAAYSMSDSLWIGLRS